MHPAREIAVNLTDTARELLAHGRSWRFSSRLNEKRSIPALVRQGLVVYLPDGNWRRTDLGDAVAAICFSNDVEAARRINVVLKQLRQAQVNLRKVNLTPPTRLSCHHEIKVFYEELDRLAQALK
jgi:hypothetical protein